MGTKSRHASFIPLVEPLSDFCGTEDTQAIKTTALIACQDLFPIGDTVLVRGNYGFIVTGHDHGPAPTGRGP